ncbi:hypothetical protein I4U23_012402 [Adineta vaga]|nr:hypothetical protein I4U23_012402 [Adineta vaga]
MTTSTISLVNTSTTSTQITSVIETTIALSTISPIDTTKISETPILNQSCYAPTIILMPGKSSLSSPIIYRRSQDFSIVSILKLSCKSSLSTSIVWTIKNCTSTTCLTTITLTYGVYELTLNVKMTALPQLKSSSTVYVKITPSGITANLVPLGTSMITRGDQQDLLFDPGTYSVDPDEDSFDATKWKYEYYCRIYPQCNFPNLQGVLLTINDSTIDPLNPSCLSGNGTKLIFGNSSLSPKSSLIILPGSLQTNQMYQFMVYMESRKNSSIQATGYVLVTVEITRPQLIIIGCVISSMCIPNLEFQLLNPTTQVALTSFCTGTCANLQYMQWNIYQGSNNSSSLNSTKWTLFNSSISYENIWFFGRYTNNFTATNQLLLNNSHIDFWRFEVVYTFLSETSSSALNFVINQSPINGSCSIYPYTGTTSTWFNVSCSDWFDEDDIKDYSLYVWTTDISQQAIIAFSSESTFQVRLPQGDNQTSLLNIIIHVRDLLNCITKVNMTMVRVVLDLDEINNLQNSVNKSNDNPTVQLLWSANQNIVGQIITSLSPVFNQMNMENINNAISDGLSAVEIYVSSLESTSSEKMISTSMNESVLIEYEKELNSQANIRDYLIQFYSNLLITTSNSIILQSSSLVQLTQATNQLTRNTLQIASNRCYQLALALHAMSTKISCEDNQMATTQLIQCASNVLTAVNGPLQERIIILDIDYSRANSLPEDYDTDIESEWSNLNLFSDGNDFSIETIEKNRNIYYQKQLANEIINQANEIISLLTFSSNIHLNIGQNLTINTSNAFMSLQTVSIDSFSNRMITQPSNSKFHIPSNMTINITNTSPILLRSLMNPLASFGNNQSDSNTNMSRLISLSIFDKTGNEISIQTNSDNPIRFIIPRDPNLLIPSMNLQNVISMNSTDHHLLFHLHYINITNALPISIHFEMRSLDPTLAYLFIFKFDQTPLLNSSINLIDGWSLLCPSRMNESMFTYFIDNQQTIGRQSLIFGLRELNSTESLQFCSNNSSQNDLPITDHRFNFTSNYELRIYTSGCYYLDSNNNWKSDGLRVGSLTNHYETECFSTHLTSFAGGFIVLPAPINWNYVFANADFLKNKTVYFTVICVSTLYIILLIYARFKDKIDLKKLGVTPLPDNHISDQYYYQIIVLTGQRSNAGTESKVYFVLSGNANQTNVRTFSDPHRKIFQRGGIDAFIVSVPESLGLLNYIRIWHDNSGEGSSASWFLKYIIVRDLQTMDKFHFICQKWFAVEKDDGRIERLLPVASDLEKKEFSYLLTKKTYHSISDKHLWISIFSRPPSAKFSCVQRCTCCFVLFFSSMLLNIMYYDLSNDAKMSNKTTTFDLSFGPVHITPEQIGIGIMVELLSSIPSILLIEFFRRIRTRQKTTPLRQVFYKINPNTQNNSTIVNSVKKSRSQITFPWWCLFIAYAFSLLIILISIFFIVVRGIEFGDVKVQKWLASVLTGFFSSILLSQPIKIVCLAIFFVCFCRNSNDDTETSEYIDDYQMTLNDDEEYFQSANNYSLFNSQAQKHKHLNEGEVTHAREQRLKDLQMWSIIREFIIYFIFLFLICSITYANRDYNSFHEVHHLRKYFYNTRQINNDFTRILTVDKFWEWLETSFLSNIRAQQWYNNDIPKYLNGYINDKSNRLIGWATMRQLRVQSVSCSDQRIQLICEHNYNFLNENKQSFPFDWFNQTTDETYSSSIIKAFQYQTSDELDTYIYIGEHGTYGGGGYVYEFRGRLEELQSNVSKLHELEWINEQTRAIIIQLTLYNPNVQLFTSVTFLLEFSSTGGAFPTARFEPLNFYTFTSLFQLICTIIYMGFIIYFTILQIQLFFQLKFNYFYQFWSLIELGIIICSWTSLAIYIWRFKESHRISSLFKQTNGYVYINLQFAVYINDLLTYLLGFSCFFSMIKFLHLIRFDHRLLLFTQTLRHARKELISFLMMFSIVYMSFVCLFYLLFLSNISSCSSLLSTAQMLFETTLMKFDTSELIQADAFLGPLVFVIFIFLVVFVCLSMFLSIINESFRCTRENRMKDVEMFGFMMNKFLRWTGLKKTSEIENYARREYSNAFEIY